MRSLRVAFAFCLMPALVGAQQLRFDDVVRNLRNPDPRARLSAIRLLRDAKYPEAIPAMAPLVLDPVDDIQLEAIAAELSFFLDQDVKTRRMVGLVIEKRNPVVAASSFDLGPTVVLPRIAPPELVSSLLQAVDDVNANVRIDAIYAVGIVARAPLTADQTQRLVKDLDHYDPAVRDAAARVIARLEVAEAGDALIKAVNDSQASVRYSAMRALGAIHESRAVAALTEQLAFYKKGEGAWSALEALARIASPASVPVFTERLQDKDPYIRRAAIEGLGRAKDAASLDTIEKLATTDESPMVRMAAAFALQKTGTNYVARIVDLMTRAKVVPQAEDYLIELGPPVAPDLIPHLQESDPAVREALADVLGFIGDASMIPALEAAAKDSNAAAAAAATRAIDRIQSRH